MQSKNNLYIAGILGVTATLLGSSVALAQEAVPVTTSASAPTVEPIRGEAVDVRQGFRKEVRDIQEQKKAGLAEVRKETKSAVSNTRVETRERIKSNIDEMHDATQAAREDGTLSEEEREALKEKREALREKNEELRKARMASTTAAREMAREEMKEKREGAREDIKKAIEERKAKMATIKDKAKEERTQEALKKAAEHAEKIVEKMSEMIDKIEDLQVRVASRIEKMIADGKDMTTASAKLAESKSHSAMARESITKISDTFATLATQTDPKKGLGKFASSTAEVRKHAEASRKSLNEAVRAIKAVGAPATTTTPTATTTVQ